MTRISRRSYERDDDECLFLYSAEDVRNFLLAVEKIGLERYTIYSFAFDGLRSFVIRLECPKEKHNECAEVLDQLFSNVSPTLLGCVDLTDVHLQQETIESMKTYLAELERNQL